MSWYVVEFPIEADLAEVAADTLRAAGANGVAEEWRADDRHSIRGFWKDVPRERAVAETDAALSRLVEVGLLEAAPAYALTTMEDQDWLEGWKQYFQPLEISPRLAVVPSWERFTPRPGQAVVTLDPGMAFGTGTHGTTYTCLRALADRVQPGMSVCDVGCGSGILAIAAAKLGAGHVVATDNDELAVRVARENAHHNHATHIDFRARDLLEDVEGPFDVVVANILAPVIIILVPMLARVLAPGGRFISSGYITAQEPDIRAALDAAGHQVLGRYDRDDWVTLVSTPR